MIIGLTGKKGAGKDTVAQYLIDAYGFVRVAFADPLKESVAALLGITLEQIETWKNDPYAVVGCGIGVEDGWIIGPPPISFRNFLQRYGTEAHREVFGEDFWLEVSHERIRQLLRDGKHVVVTDVRFENEAELIRGFDGDVFDIWRPGLSVADLHASEQTPEGDYDILNDGTLDHLADVTDRVLAESGFELAISRA